MVITSSAQELLSSTFPCLDAEHVKAAMRCCSLFEEIVVPELCRGHERADPKLTSSERTRITDAFLLGWRIILTTSASPNDLTIVREQVESLPPMEIIHLFDLARFMINNLTLDQHHEIASLMGHTTDEEVRNRWVEVCEATSTWLVDVKLGYHQPDYAPLGLGLLFDDWQEELVVAPVEEWLTRSHK